MPVRVATEEDGRLGKAGRVFDGAELNPEKRGIRKLLNIILELIHLIEGPNASHRLDILLANCLWDKAKRIGKEFLENLTCAVLWFFAEAPEFYILRELHDTVKKMWGEIVTGGWDRIIKNWKKDRNEAAEVHTGDPFGTVTGDVMEMDSIIRESWLPILAKHGDGKSAEPSVVAFVEGFWHHTPTHKQDLIDIEPDDMGLPWL